MPIPNLLASSKESIALFKAVADVLVVASAIGTGALLVTFGTLKAEGLTRRGCYFLASFLACWAILKMSCSLLGACGNDLLAAQLRAFGGVALVVLTILMGTLYRVTPNFKMVHRLELETQDLACKNRELSEELRSERTTQTMRRDIVAHVSHEFRSPLSAVIGFHELLSETKLDAEQKQLLSAADDSAATMLGLVSDMQDLVRIEDKILQFEVAPFSITSVIREACAACSSTARRKRLFLNTDVDGRVPATVFGDASRLRQILIYLISSAVKHTDSGGIIVRADLDEEDGQSSSLVRFWVKDTGLPMADDERRQLYEPFPNVLSGGTRRLGEMGLRLYLARKLVEMMGATMTVQSNKSPGCILSFAIRLAADNGSASPTGVATIGGADARTAAPS